jgi:hypothetical protein
MHVRSSQLDRGPLVILLDFEAVVLGSLPDECGDETNSFLEYAVQEKPDAI